MSALRIFILLLSLIFVSCDKGLSPEPEEGKSGFGGKITFIGEWNPLAKQTNIVVFKNPLLSVSDFNIFNLKFVSESIPNGVQSYEYTTLNDNSLLSTIEAGLISYIAVAQSEKDTLSLSRDDWKIVGIYSVENEPLSPSALQIPEAAFVENINILCDFNNPPPQPPGKESLSIIDLITEANRKFGDHR